MVVTATFLMCAAFMSGAETAWAIDDSALVDLASVDKSILVELRYATLRNVAGKALYPAGSRCIVRRDVAESLKVAQNWVRQFGYGLKIWDAYRPPSAQMALWEVSKNRSFVASPEKGHSLHTWGVAVDVTLVDANGKELKMPTDFDDFSPAAAMRYRGSDPAISRNLSILQGAMARGGFIGMRTEWWHFIGKNWQSGRQLKVDSLLPGKSGLWRAENSRRIGSQDGAAQKDTGANQRLKKSGP